MFCCEAVEKCGRNLNGDNADQADWRRWEPAIFWKKDDELLSVGALS
jgi:hypothetical protein